MKVKQFLHANQFHIYDRQADCDIDCLQSYNSLVVKIEKNNTDYDTLIVLGRDWDYSKTTSTHVFAFLEEYSNVNFYGVSNKRQFVNKLIKDGVIIYDENMQ